MSVEKPLPINLPAFTLLEEPELAFASGNPKARHRHPLLGLSRFGAFDQASYRHYSQDLRVAYVGPRSGAALVRDMRESLRGPQRNTDNNSYAQAYPGFESLFGVDLLSADKQAHVVWPEELYDLGQGDTVSKRVRAALHHALSRPLKNPSPPPVWAATI